MSDFWNDPNMPRPEEPAAEAPVEQPVEQPAEAPAENPVETPVTPVAEPIPVAEPTPAPAPMPENPISAPMPEEPTPAPAPSQPAPGFEAPMNGWSSNGSYRYVPPRDPDQTPPVPPTSYAPNNYPNGGSYPPPQQPQQPPYGGYRPDNGAPQGTGYRPNGQPAPQQQGYAYQPGYYGNGYQPAPSKPPRKKSGSGWIVAVAVAGVVALLAAIVLMGIGYLYDNHENDPVDPGETSGNHTSRDLGEDAPSLSITDWDDDDGGLSTKEVINRNYDCTVVLTIYTESSHYGFGESSMDKAGAASGIVMTEDGYIITNWHCVTNENTGERYPRVDVNMYDGTVFENAEIIGADESTDLAVIKVKAKGLSPAQFGDSSELSVGDRVIAFGNAAGLSWTATQGIVSALARDVYEDTGYAIKCLQTDAAINFGNSGGPLLNNQGLVVGINSSKIASSGYEGLGFSIPINEAKVVIDSLIKNGYVKGRVALGISGQTIASGRYEGFLISEIDRKSDLNNTNVQVGDLIVAVDGVTITDYSTLRAELAKHSVGDKVTLTLYRSDSRTGRVSQFTAKVKLMEQSE